MRNVQWGEREKSLWNLSPIQDITDSLPTNPNTPYPPSPRMRKPEDITHIALHHSGVDGQTIDQYAAWHVTDPNGQHWERIGYHLVIRPEGTFQVNDLLYFSYHTKSNNYNTIGVCVSGDYTKHELPDFLRNYLYATCIMLMGIFPNITIDNIMGHKEYPENKSTDCPGYNPQRVRDDLHTLMMKLQYLDSGEAKKTQAFAIANQILYMYNMAQGTDGNAQWSQDKLIELYPFMKQKGLL